MAGMFYSLQEAAAKLKIKQEQVEELVKEGRLREFRDGANVLFKVEEVDALMSDTRIQAFKKAPAEPVEQAEAGEISLASEAGAEKGEHEELMEADTVAGGLGINILGETDSELEPTDDTTGETKGGTDQAALEEIEEDVNLDTFGSGSGLLDLSLQADDTSLGSILDEIYTAEGEQETREGSALEVVADTGPPAVLPEEELAVAEAVPEMAEMPAMAGAYAEPGPDKLSNAFGIMLFLPLLVLFYTAIVAVTGFNDVMPAILGKVQAINGPYNVHIIWYVMLGFAVVAAAIVGAGFMTGGGGAKAVKKEKVKKPKKAKKAKAKSAPADEEEGV